MLFGVSFLRLSLVSAPTLAGNRHVGQEYCTPDSQSRASNVFAGPTQTGGLVVKYEAGI